MTGLAIEDLWKCFGGNQVLKGLSLTVETGSITGVVAANGEGKTTMINVVFGVYPKDQGRILFRGIELPDRPERVVARGIARTFQNAKLAKHMTVSETLRAVLLGRRLSWGTFFPRVHSADDRTLSEKRLLTLFGLESCANIPASTLPFAQQRKLDLARAVATGARFLFLDEPAAGLSEVEENDLASCIRELRDSQGFTFVVIDHRIEFLRGLVDRVVFLHDGKVKADSALASVETLLQSSLVREHYFGGEGAVAGVPRPSHAPTDVGGSPPLSVHKVSIYRGGMPVVRSVDYACQAGELSSIIGPNGSGKSSLLECMAGMIAPKSGSVRVDGKEMDPSQITSGTTVALVPESLDVFPGLSVEENLRLGCRNGTRASWREALAEIARIYPVFERHRRLSGSVLSGGERKVMAIARARMGRPRVLLVDEASAGLAPAMIHRTYTMLREATGAGIAAVTAESQPGVCEAYSVRVDRLHRGEFEGGATVRRISDENRD